MDTALHVHRLPFALTSTYHSRIPQLTIGLALFMGLVTAYFFCVYHQFVGKVRLNEEGHY